MSTVYSKSLASDKPRVSPFAYPLIGLILIYRYTLSPVIGQSCRFEPTCSHYAEQALRKYGAWRGSIMAVKRILKCHPWHEGGYDPVE
jgi:putative membrane protein insertion efficiency factor